MSKAKRKCCLEMKAADVLADAEKQWRWWRRFILRRTPPPERKEGEKQ